MPLGGCDDPVNGHLPVDWKPLTAGCACSLNAWRSGGGAGRQMAAVYCGPCINRCGRNTPGAGFAGLKVTNSVPMGACQLCGEQWPLDTAFYVCC